MPEEAADEQFTIEDIVNPQVDRRLRRLPGLIKGALRLVWAAGRRELMFTAALQIVGSLALVVQLLAGRALLSDLLATRHDGSFTAAIPAVILVAVAVAVASATNTLRFELQQLLSELVSRQALDLVIERACEANLLAFESPAYHDRLQRALYNGSSRPVQLATGTLSLIGSVAGSAGVGVTLLFIQPLFLLFALVAIVPVGLATLYAGRALYRFGFLQTARDRQRQYLQLLLTQRDPAKEIRAYDLGHYLLGTYRRLYGERIAELRRVVRRRAKQSMVGSVLTSVLSGGSLGLLIWFVSSHRLSLAGAGAAAAGLLLLGNQLQGLVSGIGGIYESSLFVQDYTSFVNQPPAGDVHGAPRRDAPETWEELAVTDVSFRYPQQDGFALSGVSMSIAKGEVIALVGENGSGKSTLAKVVAGLYPPSAGAVTWDGGDIAEVDGAQRSSKVAVLFQDFVRYQLDALANVTVGSWPHAGDLDRADRAAEAAGATRIVEGLPHGWDTQLGPQFLGGVDLSGGQWQRIALARALFRDAPLVILDEPTAALDPRAEQELFAAVRELFAGRSVLLITHRFTSAQLADRIYVLEAGHVVEEGAHAALVAAGGLYAELFSIQAAFAAPQDQGATAERGYGRTIP